LTATVWLPGSLFRSFGILGVCCSGQVYRYRQFIRLCAAPAIKWSSSLLGNPCVRAWTTLAGAIFPLLNQFDSPYQIMVNVSMTSSLCLSPCPLHRHPALPAVGHRYHHQSHAGLRRSYATISLSISWCVGLAQCSRHRATWSFAVGNRLIACSFNRCAVACNGRHRLIYGEPMTLRRALTPGSPPGSHIGPRGRAAHHCGTVAQALKLPYTAITLKHEQQSSRRLVWIASRKQCSGCRSCINRTWLAN